MISVIIPTYNEEKTIGALLSSLAVQQGAGGLEIVVADAFSADKTRDVALSYRHHFKDLLVVDGGMPGPGRNKGAKASSGDLLFFIDADIVIPDKTFISKAAEYFRKNKLGISTVYLTPMSDKIIDEIFMGFYNAILYVSVWFRALGAMCIIADRKVFETVGGYPEDVVMNEDHDLMLVASRVGKYGITPLHVNFSVRRFEKEGRSRLIWKYAQATYHNLVHGPIKKPIFKYEFGYDKKDIPEQ